jgi:SNF2 family DNA or RNA helicase
MTGRPYSALHEYQQAAIDWIFNHDHSLALLPVGAGKTVVSWTAIAELMDEGHIERPLVFAPLRVAQLVWAQERDEWEHLNGRPVIEWGGEPAAWADSLWKTSRQLWGSRVHLQSRLPKIEDVRKRREAEGRLEALIATERATNKQIRRAVPPRAVHITSYENLPWLCELYEPGKSPFDMWVFDEIGKLKNPKSPRYKSIKKHTRDASIVVGLNATPAPEGFEDLFSQVTIVDGGKLWGPSFHKWRQKYFTPVDYFGYSWRLQIGAADLLLKDLNTLAFKVDEAQLSYQKSMNHSQIGVDLPPKARAAYTDMAKKMAVEIEGKEDVVAMSMAAASMKLRQIANGFVYSEDGATHILHQEKAHALAELIDDMGREPLIVSYEFNEDLEAIRRVWKNVPYLGQGIGSAKAKETIDKWNRREFPVLALHRFSAGHGLNLQAGGSHVAWYSLPWDLEGYLQLNGRVDRQGQTRACYSHHILARDTIDQKVSDVLVQKNADQNKIISAIRSL